MNGCPFCEIVTRNAPATIVRRWPDALAIAPLNPVVSGHVLIIPKTHVPDATDPLYAAIAMYRAAELAKQVDGDLNLITSVGPAATQTVRHLHIHLVPRSVCAVFRGHVHRVDAYAVFSDPDERPDGGA